MQFRIKHSDASGVTVMTDAGHEFRLAHEATPIDSKTDFHLGDLQADLINENERPQMAHAILNEIIGAETPQQATVHATESE